MTQKKNEYLEIYNQTESWGNRISEQTNHKEIESVIKNICQRISPGPNDFTGKFYKIVKEVMPTLLKLFHKIEEEETL